MGRSAKASHGPPLVIFCKLITHTPLGGSLATTTLPERAIIPDSVVTELYRKMLITYFIEERMRIFVRQGKCGFHASTRGHEKLQVGITMLLRPGHDWFYTYYREKGIAVGLGMPIKDIFMGMLGREGDPNSNGR